MNATSKARFDAITVGDALPERAFTASNVSLFLYNAAIWNAHRIHYDAPYTTDVEKHPAVVIDGPLQGDWMSQCVLDWMGEDGRIAKIPIRQPPRFIPRRNLENRGPHYGQGRCRQNRHHGTWCPERGRRDYSAGECGGAFRQINQISTYCSFNVLDHSYL